MQNIQFKQRFNDDYKELLVEHEELLKENKKLRDIIQEMSQEK